MIMAILFWLAVIFRVEILRLMIVNRDFVRFLGFFLWFFLLKVFCLLQKSNLFAVFWFVFDLGLKFILQLWFFFLKLLVLLNQILTLFQQIVISFKFFVFSFCIFWFKLSFFIILIFCKCRNGLHTCTLFKGFFEFKRFLKLFIFFRLNKFFWGKTKIVRLKGFRGWIKSAWFAITLCVFLVIISTR